MRKPGLRYGLIASFAAASTALALAGCGGDDGGVSGSIASENASGNVSAAVANSLNNGPAVSMYPQGLLPTSAQSSNGPVSITTTVTPVEYSVEWAKAAFAQQSSAGKWLVDQ